MKLDEVKRIISTKRTVNVNIKITKHLSKWLTDNKVSPTALFVKAAEELGHTKETE